MIAGGPCATRFRPLLETAQLDAQNGALQSIHAVIETFEHVVVLALLPPIAKHPHQLRAMGVARDQHAALAARAEILPRVEAEATEVAERPHALPAVFGSVGL